MKMTAEDHRTELAAARTAVEEAQKALARAQLARRNAAVTADAAGFPVAFIAQQLGLTRQRVYQVLRHAQAGSQPG